ncbi:MAG: UDP-N-acetylmuramyl-tripeptide synthetase [Candidatus Pacebacteria bacterium]|nr:UDP-N-acetylmuramyl-tripeptide synthetase [Candidatus Paceibacterota bacterium]
MRHVRRTLLAPYHYALAVLAAFRYDFPAKKLTVIGVTGTKGKSSVAEMLYAILTAAGHPTALAGTIRFVIGTESRPNLFKMTLPGRGFIQKFLAEALTKRCTHVVVEITSEAALQYRHWGLALDALIFTNLQKEHVESHGSMDNYFNAKFAIARALQRSPKRPRSIIANSDDAYGGKFLSLPVEKRAPFSLTDATGVQTSEQGVSFSYKNIPFTLSLPGTFTILNALAAIKAAESLGVPLTTCAKALRELSHISGRVERIEAGQDFIAVVDYAHTPDSLTALYSAFPHQRKICVLGNTGGGRDTWKRPEMGRIADESCEKVILTNEDPYDEDPRAIVDAMAEGMKRQPHIIMNRREAIRAALRAARAGDAVLISGKGTDPYIMEAHGTKTPWSDARVVREELEHLLKEV